MWAVIPVAWKKQLGSYGEFPKFQVSGCLLFPHVSPPWATRCLRPVRKNMWDSHVWRQPWWAWCKSWTLGPDFPWEQHHCLESSIRSIRPATAAESWSETTSQKGHKMRPTFCPTHLSRRNLRKPHARSYSPRLVQHGWGGAFSTCTMLGFCRIVVQFGCPSPYHFGRATIPGQVSPQHVGQPTLIIWWGLWHFSGYIWHL